MGTLAFQTSSLNHLLNSEHDLNFDQRDDDVDVKNHHQHGSNGNNNNHNNNSPDEDDDCTATQNDGTLIGSGITE